MAVTINASTTAGLVQTADTSGVLALQTAGTTAVTVDASQNVGIGVTPSAWVSTWTALQVKNGSIAGFSNRMYVNANSYFDGSNNRYIATDFATRYYQVNGIHAWEAAPSGTAGNAITFTQVLAVEKAKSLALEGATSVSGTGISFPATQSASSDPNTLDDYEEGTWSAVVTAESGSITTYAIDSATYTKTGNTVYVYLRFNVSNKGTGSNFVVSGLPFTAARELLGIWSETNTTGLTGFMFTAGTGATSFTSRLAAGWGGACLVNGNYTVQVTYRV